MIEETDQPAGQLYPQRNMRRYSKMDSADGQHNFLREAFSTQAYYDQFCVLMSQLFQQNSGCFRPNFFVDKSSFDEKRIQEKIGLNGKIKRGVSKPRESHQESPESFRATIKLFEEALKNKVSLQKKREFLKIYICQQLQNTTKTSLDFKQNPLTKEQMYRNMFESSDTENDLSLASLQKQFSKKTKQSKYDFILDMKLLKICFGHDDGQNQLEPGSSIYNIAFDKSGKLLFSADQQGLIKIWSKQTGLLLYSLRGHTSYIEQIYIAQGNKYLISSGPEGIRIWSLEKFQCVGVFMFQNNIYNSSTYFSKETGLLIFIADATYLYMIDEATIKQANGGMVLLQTISRKVRLNKPQDRVVTQICINSNGYCIVGIDSGQIILLDREFLQIPDKYNSINIKQHSKTILELSWNKSGTSFISGCTDGTCKIWNFNSDICFLEGNLSSIAQLRMVRNQRKRKQKQIICNTVAWTCHDTYVLACFAEVNIQDDEDRVEKLEGEILVYHHKTKKIIHQVRNKLFYKLEAVTILEPHPKIEEIALFCENNGRIVLLNIQKCQLLNVFHERCYHLDYPGLLIQPIQARFSPDGRMIAVSTQHGNITLYGSGNREMYFQCPMQQFFVTDRQIFIPNQNGVPISVSAEVDINSLQRYPMGNVRNSPYDFEYTNNLQQLANKGFFSEKLIAVPISKNPYKTDKQWEKTIDIQVQENIGREEALKAFYTGIEASSNQELTLQQKFLMDRYKQALNSSLLEFNSISGTISKPQIKVNEVKKRLRKSKHRLRSKRNMNVVESDQKSDVSEKSLSYRHDYNYSEEEQQQISYQSSSSSEVINIRTRARRRVSSDDDDSVVKNSRKPPAQRIQELDQIYDEIQERKNRRRERQQRREEEEEEIPQENKRNNEYSTDQLCARCSSNIVDEADLCTSCHTIYCKDCKVLRGIDQGWGFACFNCLFLKKHSRDYEKNILRKNLSNTERDQYFYIPQIDDEVYFFYQGYQDVLTKFHDAFNPEAARIFQEFQLLAVDALEELKTAPLCRITDMEYLFPVRPRLRPNNPRREAAAHQKIKQILIVVELLTEKGLTFQVFFVPGFSEFLVRRRVIDYVLDNQKQLQRKILENNIETLKNEEQVQIVKIKPFYGRTVLSLWKTVEVVANEEGTRRLRRDLHKTSVNIWDITSKMPEIPFNNLNHKEAVNILEAINRLRASHSQLFRLFDENVNLEEYPHYLKSVEMPMCVQTIVQRIKNGYYNSMKSVIFDLKLITKASSSFSGPDHEVTLAADELVSEIVKAIGPQTQQILKNQSTEINMLVQQQKQIPMNFSQPQAIDVQNEVLQPQKIVHRRLNRQSNSSRSASPQYQPEVLPQRLQRNIRPTRNNGGRNTRANPQVELSRRDRRAQRVNYREMEVELSSESNLDDLRPTRRSARNMGRH